MWPHPVFRRNSRTQTPLVLSQSHLNLYLAASKPSASGCKLPEEWNVTLSFLDSFPCSANYSASTVLVSSINHFSSIICKLPVTSMTTYFLFSATEAAWHPTPVGCSLRSAAYFTPPLPVLLCLHREYQGLPRAFLRITWRDTCKTPLSVHTVIHVDLDVFTQQHTVGSCRGPSWAPCPQPGFNRATR